MDIIHAESAGIARMINRIYEKRKMYASQQNKHLVDEHTVQYVIDHEILNGSQ